MRFEFKYRASKLLAGHAAIGLLAFVGGVPVNPAIGATFVSLQEGDLRTGGDQATVGTTGMVVTERYDTGATVIRSDEANTPQNGGQLLVGNSGAPSWRTLLAFDLTYLSSRVGTNIDRIDSAALVLTHDNAGAGGNSVQAVHLTLPFDETAATWNDPHGTGADAGGFVGPPLRERGGIGTNVSPAREIWGSPGSFWTNGGTGPDLLVEAVRSALTNADKTLHLLVKRKTESASSYFSRYQDDRDPETEFRPELIVGADSLPTDSAAPGELAWYCFSENDNTAVSLAAVAAGTVLDSNRIVAFNAVAGGGLGQFGPGGAAGSMHGYGTGAFVSAPSGFYARASVTAADEAGAVSDGDYVGFTLGPQPGWALDFTGLSARVKLQASNAFSATVSVRSSLDGFDSELAAITVPGNGTAATFEWLTNSLVGPAFHGVVQPLEFRFYLFDDTDSGADIVRLDDVGFFGVATNLPPGVQIVMLEATDSTATESGGDTGEFLLRRAGDTSGALTVFYAVAGSASNGVDFVSLDGMVDFGPGITNMAIPVRPLDDVTPEPEEIVFLTLNSNAGYMVVGPPSATVYLADDNDPPEFVVDVVSPYAYEGGLGLTAEFRVRRPLGDTNSTVTVQFGLSGTASNGADYLASATNAILFDPGVTARIITITPLDDAELEGGETVVITLLPGTGYTVGGEASAVVTVFDDEGAMDGSLWVEAESFGDLGGWVVDQQFVDLMGSTYLLAHGKGRPVADASTMAQFPAPGAYRLWVRTKDWTAPLPDHPGSFKVVVGGTESAIVFGTVGQGWLWQDGGVVIVTNSTTEIRLDDLTGFDGRCDALFFTTDLGFVPPVALPDLTIWRRAQLGLPAEPRSGGDFDLVIVGGGISGCSASIAAARQGLKVALIHDRPFPGGNASRDVRVHTLGNDLGGITAEINTPDLLIGSDEFIPVDEQRMQVLRAETNLHLFLEWRAFRANTNGSRIRSVDARHNRTGEERRFHAPVFIDSTGDGWIGYWAGALHRMGREARDEFAESLAPLAPDSMTLGTTLSWNSRNLGVPVSFPAVPWATNVAKDYYQTRGDWYWEYGLLIDTIDDAEEIRDHLFRAIYGTWWNVKQRPGNENLAIDWMAYIGGKRESRRLIGDYILTEADVRNHPYFPDAVVTERREIDLHYPRDGIYDFLTYAQFTSISPYWIPFRCLYSTNIDNLMMAGRCLSATHVGLGSARVMNTGGQMGVATGNAAALCKKHGTNPRGVYQKHMAELQSLIGLNQYFGTPDNTVSVIDNADTNGVEITGAWTSSTSNSGFYRSDYLHDGNAGKGAKSVRFRPDLPLAGNYHVYLRWTASGNRADNVPVDIHCADGTHTIIVNQQVDHGGWALLGTLPFELGSQGTIVIRTTGTTAYVIADAMAVAAAFDLDPGFDGVPWADDDKDGVCNYAEWLNGTDSLDPLSFVNVRVEGQNGAWVLRFVAMAGKSYTVLYRDSLSDGPWQELEDVEALAVTREVAVADAESATRASRFYRLVTPKIP